MDEKLKCPHKRIDHNGECLDCDEPVWATPIAKPDINVEAALKRLSELEPIIQELVEARKKCRPYQLHDVPDELKHEALEKGIFECPMCEGYGEVQGEQHINTRGEVNAMNVLYTGIGNDFVNWQKFVDLAANRISKIGGVDG